MDGLESLSFSKVKLDDAWGKGNDAEDILIVSINKCKATTEEVEFVILMKPDDQNGA